MTPEQRTKASTDLTLTYLGNYFPSWRLTKVLANKKLLNERYSFYKDISKIVRQLDDIEGEATIAQEIQNGIIFDSIAECIQYIEDLFALIKASRNPDYFIKNIVTYNAGTVTNTVKSFKLDRGSISRAFHFPIDLKIVNLKDKELYNKGVDDLIQLIIDLKEFYYDFLFFYTQYKHGLAVGMRPHGNLYNKDQIEKDKNGEFEFSPVVYDNMNLKAASKKGTFNIKVGVMMPGFTENVRPFIGHLEKSNNFLRIVYPPNYPNFTYKLLIDTAYKTRTCLNVFIANFSHAIMPKNESNKFQLPCDDFTKNEYIVCNY